MSNRTSLLQIGYFYFFHISMNTATMMLINNFRLFAIGSQLSPETHSSGIELLETDTFGLHCMQTMTGEWGKLGSRAESKRVLSVIKYQKDKNKTTFIKEVSLKYYERISFGPKADGLDSRLVLNLMVLEIELYCI